MRITDALLAEHAVFYAQFSECERSMSSEDAASLLRRAAMIACALAPHAQLEDDLLFRALEQRADVPAAILRVMRQEHDAIEAGLSEIQRTWDVARVRTLLTEVIENARNHFAKEERVLFPLAEELLTDSEQETLAAEWATSRGVYVAV